MYYYNNELPPKQGWICPKCGRVNAPWMPTCGCVSSQTSGTPYLVEISSISRDSHEIAKDEPQTEMTTEQIVNELLSIKQILDDGKMPKQRCGNCKHLTYRWNKTWCDIKCDNPHDMVCDKWERSE